MGFRSLFVVGQDLSRRESVLLDLAQGISGKSIHDIQDSRVFIGSEFFRKEIAEIIQGNVFVYDQIGGDGFAPFG